IMTAESASSVSVKSSRSVPSCSMVKTRSVSTRLPAGSAASWATAAIDRPIAATTTAMATTVMARLPKRRCKASPHRPLSAAPHSGTNGMTKSQPESTSVSQRRHVVRVDRMEVAENREHDGERDGGLGGGEHDDEERED